MCGCNGETYANPCYAHATGTSIQYKGPCIAKKVIVPREETRLEYPSTGAVKEGNLEGAGDVVPEGQDEVVESQDTFELE